MNNVEKHNLGHPTLIFESCKKAGGGGGGGGGCLSQLKKKELSYQLKLQLNQTSHTKEEEGNDPSMAQGSKHLMGHVIVLFQE